MQVTGRSARVMRALLLVAAAVLATTTAARAEPAADAGCTAGVKVWASPHGPWKGAPLRVVAISDKARAGTLSLIAPGGKVVFKSTERHGGPPYFWYGEIASPAQGKWQASLSGDGADCDVTHDIDVARSRPSSPGEVRGSVWPLRESWGRDAENLYSAWIEKLFDDPLDAAPSWKALHEVLRDRSRNFLFNHLGQREDERGIVIRPDCADLPYFLRAYFAFKIGLPFGYSKCTRGGGGHPPRCPQWWNIQKEEPPPPPPEAEQQAGGQKTAGQSVFDTIFGNAPPPPPRPAPGRDGKVKPGMRPQQAAQTKPPPQRPPGLVPGFGFYLGNTVADGVHSGAGRTPLDDDNSDYYAVPLSQDALRPGTVYADPYGHLLVLARRVPQTPDAAGVLLAVDGQPDGTVARKRFWRGNFLFAKDPALGGPGFKHFRPIVRERGGGLKRLANAEIARSPEYGNFSSEQAQLSVEAFYDRMDDVLSPAPLDPERAMLEAITALEEQVKARVTSVENGRKYHLKGGREVAMPDGASIFETTGAWEDFATPSRDLRLLIAIDVVRGFPERVSRRPERYAMPAGKTASEVKAALEARLASELSARKFTYPRTDGSEWRLTLADVVERVPDLEMAYNLNDCVELRWGAREGSQETATCKRRAPPDQRGKMAAEYRPWFHERRRPPRG